MTGNGRECLQRRMGRETHDIAIIGGGIAGLSLAHFLAKAGLDTCVIERNTVGAESTGRCAGIIGQGHRHASDLPLVMRAMELWKRFAVESDLAFDFRQQGTVSLAWSDQHATDWKAMAVRERARGLDCTWLDRAETHDVVPAVRGAYLGSVFYPSDASADPYPACVALARAAVRAGAVIHERRAVTGIEVARGRVVGVRTTDNRIAAERVVVAAGSWSASLGRPVGVRIPAEARRSHLIITEKVRPILGPVVTTHIYGYFRQSPSGNLLIGYPARPVEGFDRRVTYDAVSIAAVRASKLLPCLKNVSVIRAFTGFTTWTSDLLSVIGPAREPKGLYVATAFCGRGFALGPAVGQLMAELILEGKASLPIDAYSVDRFEQQCNHIGTGSACS
jgi:sarcosine oxidase subunit beta